MKKFFVAVAALATLLFVSCNKAPNYPSLIQGTWDPQTIQLTITKNGKAVTAADFVAGITNAEVKQTMTELFNRFTKQQEAKGATITFQDGKISASGTILPIAPHEGEYTISGSTLTVKADGETASFTIESLTSSNLSLTFDPEKIPGYKPEIASETLEGYNYTMTINFTKK